ncbi:hypothetical protein ACLBR5_18255 [Escherichia coli]
MALPTINVGDAAIGVVPWLRCLSFGRVWAFDPVTFRPCWLVAR